MHRQGNFYAANFKAERRPRRSGPDGDVNVFYLPTDQRQVRQCHAGGRQYAVAFNDKPETVAMMKLPGVADYSNNRIKANKGGFLSPNKNDRHVALRRRARPHVRTTSSIAADPVRFDASDLMPGEVGAGAFWKEGTNYVNGTEAVDEFLKNVQAAWPTS